MVSAAPSEDEPARPHVRLRRGHSKRLRRGHPWIYSNEIEMDATARGVVPGELVEIVDAGDERLGVATFNPHSLIAARLLTPEPGAAVGHAFIADRLHRAKRLREAFYDAPYYRLAHAEADGLPGLVVERYGDVAVCQINTAGMERLGTEIISALDEVFAPRAVVFRGDSPVRQLEGLDSRSYVAKGAIDGPIEIVEGGVRMPVDVVAGQKTGWYFDQRDNRDFVAGLCDGKRVLDVYCHTGAFALRAAAAGAEAVVGIEKSEASLGLAEAAADNNGLAGVCRFVRAEAFSHLAHLHGDGARFDVVIADPPSFARTRKDAGSALRAYRKLTRLAASLVELEGFLVVASCSHHVETPKFLDEVHVGLRDAGRTGRLLRIAGAGPDHPAHTALLESAYLKCATLALD